MTDSFTSIYLHDTEKNTSDPQKWCHWRGVLIWFKAVTGTSIMMVVVMCLCPPPQQLDRMKVHFLSTHDWTMKLLTNLLWCLSRRSCVKQIIYTCWTVVKKKKDGWMDGWKFQVLIIAEMKSDKMSLFSNTTHTADRMHLSNPAIYEVSWESTENAGKCCQKTKSLHLLVLALSFP